MAEQKEKKKLAVNVPQLLYSVDEAAMCLGLAPRTIYNSIGPKAKRQFPIKPVRIGKLVKFSVRDIERFIKGE